MLKYIITLLFALFVIQDLFTQQYLMEFTVFIVPKFQESFLNTYLQPLYIVITLFGYSKFMFVLMAALYVISPNKISILKIVTLTFLAIYIQNTLKLLYAVVLPSFISH